MVARYIKELLQERDEIIVQDLGTFHTSYYSAEIHPVSHAFTAPNKNISFQTKIKASNFLLENYIAQKENISLEEAKEEVQKFVSTLKVSLGVEKRVPLENIGELVLQVTDEIEFKQDKQTNILKDSFGLPEIYAKPIERNGVSQNAVSNQAKKATTLNKQIPTEEPKSTWGTVAAIGSLAFVVLAVVYVVAVDSSLNPFNALLGRKTEKKENSKKEEEKSLVQTEIKQENENKLDESKIEENNTNTTEENTNQSTTTEENKTEENTQTQIVQIDNTEKNVVEEKKVEEKISKNQGDGVLLGDRTNQFYIVIGGFASQNNAYKKVREAKTKGVENVKIVPPFDAKNLYRVSIGAFATREQAEANLEEIKNTFNVEAWVLKY